MTISYSDLIAGGTGAIEHPSRPLDLGVDLHLRPKARGLYRQMFKRTFDVAVVMIAAPIILPLIAGLAFAVRRDGGSAFYTQKRVGLHGRHFCMWKLRSMVSDADDRMAEYLAANPQARIEWDQTQKLKRDPRITPFGQFLRKSSLDELPQLWNVLVGEMSLVGPRPIMLNQQALYPGAAYYGLRPGITGFWQTSGRNNTTFEARADYDAFYDAELSLMTDMRVLSRTVGVVMKCTGY
ncbi:Sugar transferase involved in LPS biosynthesis (colanic, teichoic acid) [Pseudorhodobacter antarcticus]|jgi:lipopolysaccharide/colanic/teichoic acid biosynthesis glycosyltransferase|uniref:Sugar transferase involved in LPS biosynthesis (Colanic, teichoic acid) n=1 Tax=Pseudorhodobacter antarcticus TaxID=1077947 RepID=A0A1H8FMQ8_9RHOB|nr:sugar transferase [Pseudorhodobacter antarcticus]SEN32467.1 Sugar transferase involved in LPS biosynthesis (colanic, teichoic acid) [Pseudorhodobacter antarcticus]